MKYLDNFNYLEFLKRHHFIGPIYPVKGDIEPIISLLVPTETAMSEIQHWSGQEVTKNEFVKYLRQNNVFVGDGDALQKLKSQTKEQRLKRTTDNAKLAKIADILEVSHSRIDGSKLTGRTGFVSEDGSISIQSRSKRHQSGITRRLGFLEQSEGGFRLNQDTTPREAEAIRAALGLKKRPSKPASMLPEATKNLQA